MPPGRSRCGALSFHWNIICGVRPVGRAVVSDGAAVGPLAKTQPGQHPLGCEAPCPGEVDGGRGGRGVSAGGGWPQAKGGGLRRADRSGYDADRGRIWVSPSPGKASMERTARMIREYHAPATVEEAVALKERLAESAVFLGGGTEVNSAAFSRAPGHVISLNRLGLTGVALAERELVIGAGCTIQQALDSADMPEIIKAVARHIFNRNIRNMATVGGQLGSNRSCGNLLPLLVVLEAVVDLAGPGGRRTIPVLQYISEERQELITQVRVAKSALGRRVAAEKYSRTMNDISVITAAVSLTGKAGAIERPIVAVGGVAKHVVRLQSVEEALDGQPPPGRDTIERLVAGAVSPITDLRGSAEFKRHLGGVLVAQAIRRAIQQGQVGP